MATKSKKKICEYCGVNELKKGYFRCDPCADKSVMDVTKKMQPVGGFTQWKQPNGEYTRRP